MNTTPPPHKPGPQFPVITFSEATPDNLTRALKSEREAHALSGYWFDFGDGVTWEHKRAGTAFALSVSEMVRCAKDDRADIHLYRNWHGQIACKLVKP